jgi:AcrR family transcriptional regulator
MVPRSVLSVLKEFLGQAGMGVQERRERERGERRGAILAAATAVFLEKGVAQATMEDIAKQAELSKGALYLYFKSKDQLYLSIALSVLDQLVSDMEDVSRCGHETGLSELHALLRAYVRKALRYGASFRVAMSWVTSDFPLDPSSELFAHYRARIACVHELGRSAFERAQADGSFPRSVPAERLGIQLWGAALGLVLLEQSAPEVQRRFGEVGALGGIAEQFFETLFSSLALAASAADPLASGGVSAQEKAP